MNRQLRYRRQLPGKQGWNGAFGTGIAPKKRGCLKYGGLDRAAVRLPLPAVLLVAIPLSIAVTLVMRRRVAAWIRTSIRF